MIDRNFIKSLTRVDKGICYTITVAEEYEILTVAKEHPIILKRS